MYTPFGVFVLLNRGKPPWTQHTLKHEVSPSLSSSRENFLRAWKELRGGQGDYTGTPRHPAALLLHFSPPTPLHLLPPPPPSGPLLFSEPGAPATQVGAGFSRGSPLSRGSRAGGGARRGGPGRRPRRGGGGQGPGPPRRPERGPRR